MRWRAKLVFAASLAFALVVTHPALAAPQTAPQPASQDDLKSVLDRLNRAAANFHSTSADVEFDTIETDPVPDTDVQKGGVYYERKDDAVRMGVHMSEHNGKPSGTAYTYIGGTFKLFEPNVNQVTTYAKAGKWESYVILGFGASGKDLQAKWNITDLGAETMNGVKTEKLELVAKDPEVRKNVSKVDIWLDPDHAVSLKQVFTLSGTSTYVCHYSNFKFNPSLPGDAFRFKTNHQTVEQTQ
jgi:outer membrane lipoprotein-sorting protein